MSAPAAELTPPASLSLVGHPLRWQLLVNLARGDHTVHELTALVEQPQNLVSYHLGKLRNAGLVSARRSTADGRDAFYAADLTRVGGLLDAAGQALHPGLRRVRRYEDTVRSPRSGSATTPAVRARLLFLCTGNSARSQMAEALARALGSVEAHSAGSHPKALHPNAVRVMRDQYSLDLAAQRSKHVSVYAHERFDRVITLCDRMREVCPEFPGKPEAVHWSIPDPAAGHGADDNETTYPAFRRTAAELGTRIGFLLATLAGLATLASPTTPPA